MRSLVSIVDDSEAVRESPPDLLQLGSGAGVPIGGSSWRPMPSPRRAACSLMSVCRTSGPDLHQELIRRGRNIPTIFITAQGNSRSTRLWPAARWRVCQALQRHRVAEARTPRRGSHVYRAHHAPSYTVTSSIAARDLRSTMADVGHRPSSTTTSRCANRWSCRIAHAGWQVWTFARRRSPSRPRATVPAVSYST